MIFGICRLIRVVLELDERCSFRRDLTTMRSVILEIKERFDIER